jgi:hypothetical protein
MTEQEWLSNTGSALSMWFYLKGKRSDRKARLCGAACSGRAGRLFPDPCLWDWITLSERYADGAAHPEELERAQADATSYRRKKLVDDFFVSFLEGDLHGAPPSSDETSRYSASFAADPAGTRRNIARAFATIVAVATVLFRQCSAAVTCFLLGAPDIEAELQAHASHEALLRDVFGNPFRPVTINPAWRTPDVLALANAAYDERILPEGRLDPARLALLANALEQAGGTDADLLDHLRGPGPHVRGCWAVDLVLAKG